MCHIVSTFLSPHHLNVWFVVVVTCCDCFHQVYLQCVWWGNDTNGGSSLRISDLYAWPEWDNVTQWVSMYGSAGQEKDQIVIHDHWRHKHKLNTIQYWFQIRKEKKQENIWTMIKIIINIRIILNLFIIIITMTVGEEMHIYIEYHCSLCCIFLSVQCLPLSFPLSVLLQIWLLSLTSFFSCAAIKCRLPPCIDHSSAQRSIPVLWNCNKKL